MEMSSYDRMISTLNKRRQPAPRTVCECGKDIFVAQLPKHQKTTLHQILMFKMEKSKKVKDQVFPLNGIF